MCVCWAEGVSHSVGVWKERGEFIQLSLGPLYHLFYDSRKERDLLSDLLLPGSWASQPSCGPLLVAKNSRVK